ncbi:hypothetical protein BY996DRAFT_6580512 [Phakopsora pachyrhizi]|nr:hypothetical protein BY996DRAFT_6580512 [Phakopsora pachyrhizi]
MDIRLHFVKQEIEKQIYPSIMSKSDGDEIFGKGIKEDELNEHDKTTRKILNKTGNDRTGYEKGHKETGKTHMTGQDEKRTKEVQSSNSGLEIIQTYQSRYGKAKKESSSTGFGLTEEYQSKGIITISQKLNLMYPCYEQMDHIFGSLPNVNPLGGGEPKQHIWALTQTKNESTDEDMPPNLGEYAPTPIIDEQLFRFPKEDEDIRVEEDINQPAMNSDIVTNDIPVPPLAPPINTSTFQKTSNSWNLNPNSH